MKRFAAVLAFLVLLSPLSKADIIFLLDNNPQSNEVNIIVLNSGIGPVRWVNYEWQINDDGIYRN